MIPRLSLRWRLILLAWSMALATALFLAVLLSLRGQRQLLTQLEKTLETKCDEVITVLQNAAPYPALEHFLEIETNYRFSPYSYFYQIRGGGGNVVLRSANLGDTELPLPGAWEGGDFKTRVHLATESHPFRRGERIRVRSERVEIRRRGSDLETVAIQTAVSLGPVAAEARRAFHDALLVSGGGLGAVFFLLWYVTSRALRPVSEMTRKASQITAKSLRERLPLAGRGDELDELAEVLNQMLDRLGISLQQVEQFSSGAAHQLRTPLTRIRGELDLILRSGVPDPPRGQLESIQEELERLSRLCGRLLLLGRLQHQASEGGIFEEVVDIEELVSEILDQMGPLAQERGVQLVRGTSRGVWIRGSRPLLVQVLLNLMANAIRYTPEGQAVKVSVESDEEGVRLSVEDRGPGVPAEERERIFEPFYRVSSGSVGDNADGSGLGLAIVRAIAQAHGGSVELTPASSGGSVFHLVVPAERSLEIADSASTTGHCAADSRKRPNS